MPEFNPNKGGSIKRDEITNQHNEPIIEDTLSTDADIPSMANIENRPDELDLVNLGLTEEELKDPNRIQITIADKSTPIVDLFGPAACGKTMTLVRLTRYLRDFGYTILPIRSFRPSNDKHYGKLCETFNENANSDEAASSTSLISFMLVKVIDQRGRTICQLLEAPGEYYYNPATPSAPFPKYVNAIKSSTNRKIWCFMVEPDWQNESDRMGYVDKIHSLKRNMSPADKVVFIYNKIDRTPFQLSYGKVNIVEARKDVANLYPGIFSPFRQKGILFGWSDKYKFVPFHTGDYSETFDHKYTFQPGPDEYPRVLWNVLMKLIRG